MAELPREIQMKIVRMLDIDTRRSIGVYTALSVPNELKRRLDSMMKIGRQIEKLGHNHVLSLELGEESRYRLVKGYDVLDLELTDYRVIHDMKKNVEYHMLWCILDED